MSNYTNPPAIVKQEQEDDIDGARADLEEAMKLGRKSLLYYKRAGEKMNRVKDACKHGEWKGIVAERWQVSLTTVGFCRDIAKHWDRVSDCRTYYEARKRIKAIREETEAAKEQEEDTNTTSTQEGGNGEEPATKPKKKRGRPAKPVEKVLVPRRDWNEFRKKLDKWGQELPEEFSSWLISWMEKLLVVKVEASNGQVNGR